LLNQRESALRKVLLNKRPKILFLDQTFFDFTIDRIDVDLLSASDKEKQDNKLRHSYREFKLITYEKIYVY
jgi:hypothetical protein